MDKDYNDWRQGLLNVAEAIATRPQKESVVTTTTSTSTPRALANMIANRDRIGQATRDLDEALKARETAGYSIANALMAMPEQQGYGSWLGNAARVFGAGLAAPTNAQVDRAQKKYEAEMKDLAEILAYDKAMGETQTQHQEQRMDYKDMPYASGKGNASASGGDDLGPAQYALLPDIDIHELNVGAGRWDTNKYDPQDKEQGFFNRLSVMSIPDQGKGDFGIAKERGDKDAQMYEKYKTIAMQGMYDVLKALRPATDTDFLAALESAGADPTMHPDVRDMRLTNTINKELFKSGLGGVKDLKNWYESVKMLKETHKWNPQLASQLYSYDKIKKQKTNNMQVSQRPPQKGTLYKDENGRTIIITNKGN